MRLLKVAVTAGQQNALYGARIMASIREGPYGSDRPPPESPDLGRRKPILRAEVLGQVGDHRGLVVVLHRGTPAHHLLHRGGPLLLGEALLDDEVGGVAGVAGRLDFRAGRAGREVLEGRAEEGEG